MSAEFLTLDDFVAAKASAITFCAAKDLLGQEPEHEHWLANFALSIIYRNFPPNHMRPFALNFIRRVGAAFVQYDAGRSALIRLSARRGAGWAQYFAALTHFELAVGQLCVAQESIRRLAQHDFYRTGDGSFEENLNLINNASKHALPLSELPVWLTNTGLESRQAKLDFAEIEDYMIKMAGTVRGLVDENVARDALAEGGA